MSDYFHPSHPTHPVLERWEATPDGSMVQRTRFWSNGSRAAEVWPDRSGNGKWLWVIRDRSGVPLRSDCEATSRVHAQLLADIALHKWGACFDGTALLDQWKDEEPDQCWVLYDQRSCIRGIIRRREVEHGGLAITDYVWVAFSPDGTLLGDGACGRLEATPKVEECIGNHAQRQLANASPEQLAELDAALAQLDTALGEGP